MFFLKTCEGILHEDAGTDHSSRTATARDQMPLLSRKCPLNESIILPCSKVHVYRTEISIRRYIKMTLIVLGKGLPFFQRSW